MRKQKSVKEPVKLREKVLKDGTISLYLDRYYKGKRTYEFLKLYLKDNPKTQEEKRDNADIMQTALAMKAKRLLEARNDYFGFGVSFRSDTLLIDYFSYLLKGIKTKNTFNNYQTTLSNLKKYCSAKTTFKNVDHNFCQGFLDHLGNGKKQNGDPLAHNTVHSYYTIFKSVIGEAVKARIVPPGLFDNIKSPSLQDADRGYLSMDELKALVKTPCKNEKLRNRFLFGCLTGLRWSDINKLKWSEVVFNNGRAKIVFRQKKTGSKTGRLEHLDISNQAISFMGPIGDDDDNVFPKLRYCTYQLKVLQEWVNNAGIKKHITFHCSRHTFATLQIEMDTDLYTVSKLLGHGSLKTTEKYAKVVDKKKREAVNKFPDISI